MISVNFAFAFFGLLFASVFDIKSREIPDWLNYSMIGVGFGVALISSVILSNFYLLLYSVLGFGIAWIISMIFYKTNQWGGGDSKALMGLGALLGFNFHEPIPLFLILLLNIFVVGAFYGFLWSFVLALKNFKKFKNHFKEYLHSKPIMKIRRLIILLSFTAILAAVLSNFFYRLVFFTLAAVIFFAFYFYIFTKIVEKVCMEKMIPLKKLTEGDWVLENIVVKGKTICSSKIPIEKEQIKNLLKFKSVHKKSSVLVREGIPFLPSFFIALVLTLLFGNWLLIFL